MYRNFFLLSTESTLTIARYIQFQLDCIFSVIIVGVFSFHSSLLHSIVLKFLSTVVRASLGNLIEPNPTNVGILCSELECIFCTEEKESPIPSAIASKEKYTVICRVYRVESTSLKSLYILVVVEYLELESALLDSSVRGYN